MRNRLGAVDDDAAGRKIGAFDMLEQCAELGARVLDQHQCGANHLGGVVRRDVRRHADRDPARAIGEQVREQARHDLGLFILAIVRRLEIDRALVEALHQVDRDARQPRLGIAVRRGVIAVDVAEIALTVD